MRKVSYAQNAEDIRVWRALRHLDPSQLRYVEVGANEPRHLSITASLYDMGWRGMLIEADPELAAQLRVFRPGDIVVQAAAGATAGELTFYRVPGTGLGTLDQDEARSAAARGFPIVESTVDCLRLDHMLATAGFEQIHFMSIDVEGAEAIVLSGLDLHRFRPWVMCIEAVLPGTQTPSHEQWEPQILNAGFDLAAFDGINRWYVAAERPELVDAVALGLNALDIGLEGWEQIDVATLRRQVEQQHHKNAWQRELVLHDLDTAVPASEYHKQIVELRTALSLVEASRSWRYTRKAGKAARIAQHKARRLAQSLPGPVQRRLIRARHAKHVAANFPTLVNPAYLGRPEPFQISWFDPDGLPALPTAGMTTAPLQGQDVQAITDWLKHTAHDTDALLSRRTDNHDDELGRLRAALDTRLALASTPSGQEHGTGDRVLFDARCLQTAAFGARGIGRFARSALLEARATVGDERIDLLIDHRLEILPDELVGACHQVSAVWAKGIPAYSVLIQPSPMTASPAPLVPILHADVHKIALVYDFIPMHYPSVYLAHAAPATEYAAALDALRRYDQYICISHIVSDEVARILQAPASSRAVAWPAAVSVTDTRAPGSASGPMVIMTGDEGRKNTYGALAAIALATAGQAGERNVVVVGMAGQETRVHHWSIHAAMRPGEAVTSGRLSDAQLSDLLNDASLVIVPSFDEGLSLPVIEAVAAGAVVVASDIPAHRELLGRGRFLADPGDLKAFARTINANRASSTSVQRQRAHLRAHQHRDLEPLLRESLLAHLGKSSISPSVTSIQVRQPLSVAFATPWSPQRSGIADYSAVIGRALASRCDLTVYTTADAFVEDGIAHRSIEELPARSGEHDVCVAVIGNSHFHLPFLETMARVPSVAIAHDTRMVELYAALRGEHGVAELMTRGQQQRTLVPPLAEQFQDMRLLQNAGMWEVARQARMLITHSPSTVSMIAEQTGVTPRVLPFAAYHLPEQAAISHSDRQAARARLGWQEDQLHVATFGYVDLRTKLVDVIVEAAGWLTAWGHEIHLHLVGAAESSIAEQLTARAKALGLGSFSITGFATDESYRDHILGIDLGVQLRISPMLGVSGPLADMAAYGTPAVASHGLAVDVDTPAFIDHLPDQVSPVLLAHAMERRFTNPVPASQREAQRRAYLADKDAGAYADQLLALLEELS